MTHNDLDQLLKLLWGRKPRFKSTLLSCRSSNTLYCSTWPYRLEGSDTSIFILTPNTWKSTVADALAPVQANLRTREMCIPRILTSQCVKPNPHEDEVFGCSLNSMQIPKGSGTQSKQDPPTLLIHPQSRCNDSDDATTGWRTIRRYDIQPIFSGHVYKEKEQRSKSQVRAQ